MYRYFFALIFLTSAISAHAMNEQAESQQDTTLTAQIAELTRSNMTLASQYSTAQEQLESAKEQLRAHKETIANLNQNINTHQNLTQQISALKYALAAKTDEHRDLVDLIKTQQSIMDALFSLLRKISPVDIEKRSFNTEKKFIGGFYINYYQLMLCSKRSCF